MWERGDENHSNNGMPEGIFLKFGDWLCQLVLLPVCRPLRE
jgi:hypothetical protein